MGFPQFSFCEFSQIETLSFSQSAASMSGVVLISQTTCWDSLLAIESFKNSAPISWGCYT